jgi:hypothetical protein
LNDDFSLAEDAVQEALLAAAVQWPHESVPANPRARIQIASRRLTDHRLAAGPRVVRFAAAYVRQSMVALTVVSMPFAAISTNERAAAAIAHHRSAAERTASTRGSRG